MHEAVIEVSNTLSAARPETNQIQGHALCESDWLLTRAAA